jgi:hypothetical protein
MENITLLILVSMLVLLKSLRKESVDASKERSNLPPRKAVEIKEKARTIIVCKYVAFAVKNRSKIEASSSFETSRKNATVNLRRRSDAKDRASHVFIRKSSTDVVPPKFTTARLDFREFEFRGIPGLAFSRLLQTDRRGRNARQTAMRGTTRRSVGRFL